MDIEIGPLSLRADVKPDSINQEKRTVDVVFSTGAPVQRADMWTGQRWTEVLSLKKGAVRLERLNGGAPFLDTHSAFELSSILGVVVPGSAKIRDGEAVATIRFSSRAAVEPVWQDVRDGIVRNVSVGYRVHKFEQQEPAEDKIPIRTAVDWEPFEISAVPMGADPGARVRASGNVQLNHCEITPYEALRRETTMEPKGTVAEVTVAPVTAEQPVVEERVEPSVAENATAVERARNLGIRKAVSAAKLPSSLADKMIADGISLAEASAKIFDILSQVTVPQSGPSEQTTRVSFRDRDPLDSVWQGITGALLHRIAPETFKLDDNARQYRSRSLLAIAEECLEQRGIKARQYSKMEIAGMALGLQVRAGLHTTADFAFILADVANKSLRAAYDAAPQTFQVISRRIPMPDFKPVKRNQLGEAPSLPQVLEHGEFTRGTIAEGKEEFQLATYGRIFGITRQALVNDDLDAFGRLTTMFGRSARNLESDLVWAQIGTAAAVDGPNMADGIAVFHVTSHGGNKATVAAAIDVGPLGIGRATMRKQKGLDNATFLNLTPRFLIVPPDQETLADKFVTQLTPAQGSNVNPFSGRLSVVSEPRLQAVSATGWYLAADPTQIDIIEYGFLDGEEGPVVESRVGFDVDGLEVKCRHDFAAKVIDYRGLFRNAGA